MRKVFTPTEIRRNRGCYELEEVNALSFITQESISIQDVMNSEISIKDKRWFLWHSCKLTLAQKKELCLKLAWCVLPIYELKYPADARIRECLEATERLLKGEIDKAQLQPYRDAAYAAYAAAYAATDAADAAYAAYAAADAAYAAAANKSYADRLKETMIEFINAQPE